MHRVRPHLSQLPLTCSVLAVGPDQVLALGHNHSEALCCWQVAERQQDLPDSIHSLWRQSRAQQIFNLTLHLLLCDAPINELLNQCVYYCDSFIVNLMFTFVKTFI